MPKKEKDGREYCDQPCKNLVSWRIHLKDFRHGGQPRIVMLCGNHASPLRARKKTSAYEVTKVIRVKQ